jgi:DUF438 domain-containing protein
MSEFINNAAKRKELIKQILKELNAGKPMEEVKEEFGSLLDDVDAPSITKVEQMLIEEGTPVQEIQRLCDIHTAFFRDSLDKTELPENLPGHPVHTLRMENEAAEKILGEVQEALDGYKKIPNKFTLNLALQTVARLIEYDRHFLRKENVLFPFLEKHNFYGPSQVMWGIHNQIRKSWTSLKEMLEQSKQSEKPVAPETIDELWNPMKIAIQEMFYKEEKILFPAALEKLSIQDWSTIKAQEAEVGYCYVQPGNSWQPKPLPSTPAAKAEVGSQSIGGVIDLDVGKLLPEQINLLLKHLPVDVTFVDENDEVRFFSATKDRVFQRSPAIIGRKVANCHPPQSVSKVLQIVEDFKSGKRDQAEFWIQMGEKFVVITYIAIRDAGGRYRGTLEVSLDAVHLRSLSGEKRLLEDKPA